MVKRKEFGIGIGWPTIKLKYNANEKQNNLIKTHPFPFAIKSFRN